MIYLKLAMDKSYTSSEVMFSISRGDAYSLLDGRIKIIRFCNEGLSEYAPDGESFSWRKLIKKDDYFVIPNGYGEYSGGTVSFSDGVFWVKKRGYGEFERYGRKSTFDYVNRCYGLNLKVGTRCEFDGKDGWVVQDLGHRVGVILDNDDRDRVLECHPTWNMTYKYSGTIEIESGGDKTDGWTV